MVPTFITLSKSEEKKQIDSLLKEIDRVVFGKKIKKDKKSESSAKMTMATSFAELVLSDPTGVTKHHLKILESDLSKNEIKEIVKYVLPKDKDKKISKKIIGFIQDKNSKN